MKTIALAALTAIILFASCNKNSDGPDQNTWTVGASTYNVTTSVVQQFSVGMGYPGFLFNNVAAENSGLYDVIKLNVSNANAVQSGLYKIVAHSPANNEVSIDAYQQTQIFGPTYSYQSTGNDHVYARFLRKGDIVIITIPKTWMKNNNDSVQLAATLRVSY